MNSQLRNLINDQADLFKTPKMPIFMQLCPFATFLLCQTEEILCLHERPSTAVVNLVEVRLELVARRDALPMPDLVAVPALYLVDPRVLGPQFRPRSEESHLWLT